MRCCFDVYDVKQVATRFFGVNTEIATEFQDMSNVVCQFCVVSFFRIFVLFSFLSNKQSDSHFL